MTAVSDYVCMVEEAADFLKRSIRSSLDIVITLGTGLEGLEELIGKPQSIGYGEIPHFPRPSVKSHAGRLVWGRRNGRSVGLLSGRLHYYEGYAASELTFPMRVATLLGPQLFIATNAAGGLNPSYRPGTIMILRDHINCIPDNPLRGPNNEQWGPRFPDMSQVYDKESIETLQRLGDEADAGVVTGTYIAIPGPSLETPAETRMYRNFGADAIGMSTVPEVIVARHAGLKVAALAVIGNVNDPDNFRPILLEEVIAQTKQASKRLRRLLEIFLDS